MFEHHTEKCPQQKAAPQICSHTHTQTCEENLHQEDSMTIYRQREGGGGEGEEGGEGERGVGEGEKQQRTDSGPERS